MQVTMQARLLAAGMAQLAAAGKPDPNAQTMPADFADKFGAKCLDGTPPTYDVALNASSTQWVLFLEGGGWCYGDTVAATKTSCASKGFATWPPSSGEYANSVGAEALAAAPTAGQTFDMGGVMSGDAAINPDFHTWNKVLLHYCDGSSFGGGRTDPIAVTRKGKPGDIWLRGRNNFDALISYFSTTMGMDKATDVILSGGSAGGLGVFYNLDHLATLLPKSVRLVGFPDAGFFMDAKSEASGNYSYRQRFQTADPVWNVTGSGGTNLKCLAANAGEEWKCLMAQYIVPHIETPMFVLNAAYDAWQLGSGHVLEAACIPTPTSACTGDQNASLHSFRDQFVAAIAGVTAGKPKNGVFLDSCYVHEQNVDYCSGQAIPNCVGWSPKEPGSEKWGYTTAVSLPNGGRSVTPQQAFGAWWKGETIVAIDDHTFFDNPTCVYLGKPKPPVPGGACKPNAAGCCDYSGEWCNHDEGASDGIKYVLVQPAGTCVLSGVNHCHNGTVSGDTLTIPCAAGKHEPYVNRTATLELATPQDILQWNYPGTNGRSKWYRGGNTGNYTCHANRTMF